MTIYQVRPRLRSDVEILESIWSQNTLVTSPVAEKYWKKYQYASKFVQLVKSKTPKVTLYTKYAKVMLMENSPAADLEVCFYDGELQSLRRHSKTPDQHRESFKQVQKKNCVTQEARRTRRRS